MQTSMPPPSGDAFREEIERLRKQNETLRVAAGHPWLLQLCAQTGENISAVPKEILELQDVPSINEKFFSWRKGKVMAPIDLSPQVVKFAKEALSAKNSQEYQSLASNVRAAETKVQALERDLQANFANIAAYKRKLALYDYGGSPDMVPMFTAGDLHDPA